MYVHCESKKAPLYFCLLTLVNIKRFSIFFTVEFGNKFVTKSISAKVISKNIEVPFWLTERSFNQWSICLNLNNQSIQSINSLITEMLKRTSTSIAALPCEIKIANSVICYFASTINENAVFWTRKRGCFLPTAYSRTLALK